MILANRVLKGIPPNRQGTHQEATIGPTAARWDFRTVVSRTLPFSHQVARPLRRGGSSIKFITNYIEELPSYVNYFSRHASWITPSSIGEGGLPPPTRKVLRGDRHRVYWSYDQDSFGAAYPEVRAPSQEACLAPKVPC